MANADSTIRVNIVGDAKGLAKATDKAEQSTKGLSKQAKLLGGALVAGFAADAVIDFGQAALAEADRVGDATGRLEAQLGDLSQPLEDAAAGFSHLGQSKQDMLELEASVIDVGTALGIADEELAPLAQDAAAAAGGLSLITDTDAATWIETLNKAAGGSAKALKALGVSVSETDVVAQALADTGKKTAESLTGGELAAARLKLILEELEPRLADVNKGMQDTEQVGATVQARFETLQGEIGGFLEDAGVELMAFILRGIEGWELFAYWLDQNEQAFRDMAGPIARLIDLLGTLTELIDEALKGLANQAFGHGPFADPRFFGGGSGGRASGGSYSTTVNVQGGSPEAIERAVRDAVRTTARRG